MILKIISFLNTNAYGLTLIATLIIGVYKFWQFVNIKKEDARQRDFENYHNLIKRLVVDREDSDGSTFIDVQIASVFELRNFARYYPATKIILERTKNRLKDKLEQKDLVAELERTIEFIDKKNWYCRYKNFCH